MDRKLKLGSSSNIKGGTYDPDTERLTVHVNGGSHYAYHSVPEHLIEGLESADSHGEFFAKHIKPHHEFTRVR